MLLRSLGRLRARLRGSVASWLGFVGLLGAVELAGRSARSDAGDVLVLFALLLVVGLAVALGWETPARWWGGAQRVGARVWRALVARYAVKIGVDLRGEPPLPRRAVPHHRDLVPLFGVWVVLALLLSAAPFSLRATITRVAYLPWFVLLVAAWTLLLGTAAALAFAAAAWIHDRFVLRPNGAPRPRARFEVLALTGLLVLVAVPGLLLPIGWALGAVVLAYLGLVAAVVGTRSFDLELAWRRPEGRAIHAVTWHATALRELAMVLLAWAALVATGDGRRLLGQVQDPATWVTGMFGALLAWVGGVVLTALFVIAAVWLVRHRRADPSRPVPTRVHLGGAPDLCARAALALREAGMAVAKTPRPGRDDVCLEVVGEPLPRPPAGETRWPLRVGPTALRAAEVLARIERRDEIQRRRRLVRGIAAAFKAAARRRYLQGTGYWIAPHWWFVSALSRDTDEEEWDPEEAPVLSEAVAPSWHRLIGHAGRAHAYRILRTLRVDFILLEDGVGFRGFRRVLRVLFERYDIQGRPLEARHLSGLPGLRCLIHDVTHGEPWTVEGYPEPDYDDISRARVLHIFRDRGGEEAPDEVPPEHVDLPDFVPVGLFS